MHLSMTCRGTIVFSKSLVPSSIHGTELQSNLLYYRCTSWRKFTLVKFAWCVYIHGDDLRTSCLKAIG